MFSKLAQIDLQRLKDQGYSPTFEDAIALNDIAVQIESGKDTTVANHPRFAFAGNVVLHEPTVGALEWWWGFGKDAAWTNEGKLRTYFFMLAHSRDVDFLQMLERPKDINKAVKIWMKSVGATDGELFRALLYVKNGTSECQECSDDDKDPERNLDALNKMLLTCSGQTGIKVEDLKTCTQSQLVQLIRASAKGGLNIKPSIAGLYIRYQAMIRKIEERGCENG